MGGAVTVLESPLGEWIMELALRRKVSVMVASGKNLGQRVEKPVHPADEAWFPGPATFSSLGTRERRLVRFHHTRKPPRWALREAVGHRGHFARDAEVH